MENGAVVAENDAAVQQWVDAWTQHLTPGHAGDDATKAEAQLHQAMEALAAVPCTSRVEAVCYLTLGVGQPHVLTAADVLAPTVHEQLQALRAPSTLSPPFSSALVPPLQLTDLDIHTVPVPVEGGGVVSQASRQLAARILERATAAAATGGRLDDEALASRCIALARLWGDLPPNRPEVDRLAAHGVFALLAATTTTTTTTTTTSSGGVRPSLTSAALAALVPLALQLADGYVLADQCLGLALLWALLAAGGRAPTSLLLTTGPWLLPALHRLAQTVPAAFASQDATDRLGGGSAGTAAFLVCRVHQVVAVACLASPTGAGTHHAHLLLQRAVQRVGTSLDPYVAWPTLLALRPFVAQGCPVGVLRCQAQPLVEALLALVNRWHLPVAVLCLQLLRALCWRCIGDGDDDDDTGAHRALATLVLTEAARVRLFLAAGQADLTGDVAAPDATVARAVHGELDALQELLGRFEPH
jgi:hypothetical protein